MSNSKFDQLIDKRKNWVKSSEENNFDFDSILSGLYNDPSHFIYEIIQNAEDVGTNQITFKLHDSHLEIFHNAPKDFDFDDVDGITGIGISTKKDDINKIGKFGVGFKSVFAITQSPIIESGSYHFKIDDFVVPTALRLNNISGTRIDLPFNHTKRKKEEVYALVENKLQDIGLKTLLFLTNINDIKWESLSQSGHYYKSVEPVSENHHANKVTIFSKKNGELISEKYLVIDKYFEVDSKKLKTEVAYKLEKVEEGEEKIVAISNQESKLVVYFPTEKETSLNFIIQGPFKTTPNRENIPLKDEQNQEIINEIASLVAESISYVKKMGYLNSSFIELLPISNEYCDNLIYDAIYKKVKEKFLSDEKLLPTNYGGFSHPLDSILARGKVLPKLLKQTDIKFLFGKSHWLNTNITYDKTRELRNYFLNELGIDEIDFEEFSKNITEQFLKTKSDKWIISFYKELNERESLIRKKTDWRSEGILRQKPFVRLKYNKHSTPFDASGKIQVFFPTGDKSSYKTIKKAIAANKQAREFFKKLGVTKPDIYAEIHKFILPKYRQDDINVTQDEYFEDIQKILSAFNEKHSEKTNTLTSELSQLNIIGAINPVTSEAYWMRPSDTYINSDNLREYFDGYDDAFFIEEHLYKKFGQEKIEPLALKIGCNSTPKRIEFDGTLSNKEKRIIRSDNSFVNYYDIYIKDYDLEGLENFLHNISKERSIILWQFLLKAIENFSVYRKERFFQGKYCWTPREKSRTDYFDSNFLKQLRDAKWLFDTSDIRVNASSISILDLSNNYIKDGDYVELLEEILGFKLNEIRIIEEKTGGKFIPHDEIDDYKQWKEDKRDHESKLNENDDELVSNSWTSQVDPEEVQPNIEELELELIETTDHRGQLPSGNNVEEDTSENGRPKNEISKDQLPKKNLKDIGNWGERFVYKHLQEEYAEKRNVEINWLNKGGDVGKGYDFSIVSDGKEIKYIEVKSKVDDAPQLIEITGTQWEFSRKLYNENEGDKYRIYIVRNAGTRAANIGIVKNPAKMWKEGKLYAHPVQFRL